MEKDEKKDALHHAFEQANYRKPTPQESDRINKAVDNTGTPGRPKKVKD